MWSTWLQDQLSMNPLSALKLFEWFLLLDNPYSVKFGLILLSPGTHSSFHGLVSGQ